MSGNLHIFVSLSVCMQLGSQISAVPVPTITWADPQKTDALAESPHVTGFSQLMQTVHPAVQAKRNAAGTVQAKRNAAGTVQAKHNAAGTAAAAGPAHQSEHSDRKRRQAEKRAEKRAAKIIGNASHGKVLTLIGLPILATFLLLSALLNSLSKAKAKTKKALFVQQQWHEHQKVPQCNTYHTTSSEKSDVLCPAHVCHPEGITFEVEGLIAPHRQEKVLEVVKVDQKSEVTMRVLFAEGGEDSGILLESADNFPIGFLNTSLAINAAGQAPPSPNREVLICRASPGCPPYAVVQADKSKADHYVVRRGSRDGPVMNMICLSSADLKVVNADSVPMAFLDARISEEGCQQLSLQINPGVDANLLLCSVLAAIKLI